jgi:hypothetical protein
MPKRRYTYKSLHDYVKPMPIIPEHGQLMGKSSHAPPQTYVSPVMMKPSRVGSVRATSTTRLQDGASDSEYEIVDNRTKSEGGEKEASGSPLKWLKKVVKKAAALSSSKSSSSTANAKKDMSKDKQADMHAHLKDPVDVEEFLQGAGRMDVRYGCSQFVDTDSEEEGGVVIVPREILNSEEGKEEEYEAGVEEMPLVGSAGRGTRDRF